MVLEIAAIVIVAFILVGLGWWLLIESEGVYLGRRVVVWLYDLYAGRYDDIKHFRAEYDHQFLAQPILQRCGARNPLVLDVATGTGRLPLALARHQRFEGRVIGVDLSRKMLERAAAKLNDPRVLLVWASAEQLPAADGQYDVVTCLEALEFMMHPDAALRECIRALRPGGLLLITNRLTGRWMPGKTWTEAELRLLLAQYGIERVKFEPWQVDYIRVWGVKRGTGTAGLG